MKENIKDEEKMIKKLKVGKPIASIIKKIISPKPIVFKKISFILNTVYRYNTKKIIDKKTKFKRIVYK
ncbi:hypothetical protein [Tenacibaculum discolor]|uniref:hypothetical protein n=1 Tax=Tenacibaculum discolor TaxID=361581 RepID=UPI003F79B2FD